MNRDGESINPVSELEPAFDDGHAEKANWQGLDGLRSSETMSVQHDFLCSSGSRVVSFPPYTTAPPLALASSCAPPSSTIAALDPNRTHRPTGDTAPPLRLVCTPRGPSLERLFSTAVMETLPDLAG